MKFQEPYFTGRANYLAYRADLFNVLIVPFSGTASYILARNLDKETALALIEDINDAIRRARGSVSELEDDEEL